MVVRLQLAIRNPASAPSQQEVVQGSLHPFPFTPFSLLSRVRWLEGWRRVEEITHKVAKVLLQ